MILGCIADDFTGATDLANTLTRRGMHTVQTIGMPKGAAPDADAVVVALKSRTIPAAEAVAQSLAACRWLKAHGAKHNAVLLANHGPVVAGTSLSAAVDAI